MGELSRKPGDLSGHYNGKLKDVLNLRNDDDYKVNFIADADLPHVSHKSNPKPTTWGPKPPTLIQGPILKPQTRGKLLKVRMR